MSRFMFAVLTTCAAAALVACGGGGGSAVDLTAPSPAVRFQGVYSGSLTGSATSDRFGLLVLENGDYWSIYGTSRMVVGFVHGQGAASGATFTTSDLRDFGARPATVGTLSATFTETSVTADVTVSGQTVNLSGARPTSATYNYDSAANLTDIVGTWTVMTVSGGTVAPASLSIGENGLVSGSSESCTFTGRIAPRASGKNVFDAELIFGGACANSNTTTSGIALTSLRTSGSQRQLIIAGINAARTEGTVVLGVR